MWVQPVLSPLAAKCVFALNLSVVPTSLPLDFSPFLSLRPLPRRALYGCVLACGLGCRRTRFPLVWVPVGVTRSVEGARVRWSAVRFAYGHRATAERTVRWGGLVWGLPLLRLLLLLFPNPPPPPRRSPSSSVLAISVFSRNKNENAAILMHIKPPTFASESSEAKHLRTMKVYRHRWGNAHYQDKQKANLST